MDRSTPQTAPPDADELLLIGRVGKTHGLRGEVKVIPETDDPERFRVLDAVYVGPSPQEAVAYPLASVRFQQTKRGLTVLAHFGGIDTVDAAAALRGKEVYASADDLPPLDEDEFFLHDLVGLEVIDEEDGTTLGTVRDVLELPTHPVLVVARPGRPDALVPAVPAFLADVDLDAGRLTITAIEGLFE